MTEIRINEAKRVIEVTKGFYKEASKFGTEEYKMLKEARNDFATFKVVTRSAGKNRDGFKGLTFDYMEKYVKEHREIEIANKQQLDNIITKFRTIKDTIEVKRSSTKKIWGVNNGN